MASQMWVSDPSGGTLKVGFNLSERIQHGTLNPMIEKKKTLKIIPAFYGNSIIILTWIWIFFHFF